jgi:hypothetical protein
MTPEEAAKVSIVQKTEPEVKLDIPQVPKEMMEIKLSTEGLDALLNDNSNGGEIKVDGVKIDQEKPEIKQDATNNQTDKDGVRVSEKGQKVDEGVKKDESKDDSVLIPPKEEKKEEVKEAVKEVVKETPKEEENVFDKLIKPPVKEQQEEDYSKYAPQIQTNLKNMSRQAREWAVELIKKNEEFEKNKNGSYLQHEEAFLLAPEFKAVQTRDAFNRSEKSLWEQALVNIREGKPYKEPVAVNQQGQIILSEEKTATAQDQIRIENNVAGCSNQIRQNEMEARNIASTYKGRIQADYLAIEAERKERFGWVADPKMLDYSLNVGNGEKKIREIREDFRSIWPPYLKNTPGVEVACDFFVALQIRNAELRVARSKATVASVREKEAARGEIKPEGTPSAKDMEQHYKINGIEVPKNFSLEGMPI